MKPIIGIVGRSEFIHPNKVMITYNDIAKAIIINGGIPIMILPPNDKVYDDESTLFDETDEFDLNKVLERCDGFVSQGGTHFYDFDRKIIEYAYFEDKPFLGICLGMQAISTVYGGQYIDLGDLSHKNVSHEVILNKNSKIYKIMGVETFLVNSRHVHHVPYTSLDIVGYSNDGIVEAVEDKDKKFFIGVQWHPENLVFDDDIQNRLFQYFVESSKLD